MLSKLFLGLTSIFLVRDESETLANKLYAHSRCVSAEGANAMCGLMAIDPSTICNNGYKIIRISDMMLEYPLRMKTHE
jgi:hypothetical protein